MNLLKIISARLVGLGSLYFKKIYGSTLSYQGASEGMLEKLNTTVTKNFETALFLCSKQVEAMNSFHFVITGFYGTGKTTGLEVALDKIIEKPLEFSDAKIVFATWDESKGLREFFSKKFEGIRHKDYSHLNGNDCLEVYSLQEVCSKYEIEPMQSNGWAWISSLFGLDRKKVDIINDLCKKLKGMVIKVQNSKKRYFG